MDKKIRVGLIFGGESGEHEVSLASAQSVARALDRTEYEISLIGITKQGRWISGGNPLKELAASSQSPLLKNGAANGFGTEGTSQELVPAEQLVEPVSPLNRLDVAFPLVHGPMGEDGTIQGLLELAHIPYVGAGVAASAVGMDKALMKDVFFAHGLPGPEYQVVLRSQWERTPEETIRGIEKKIGYPCFVKPANLGSSVGITKAHDWDELTQALVTAAQYDRKMLIEEAIVGREIECSVLGNDEAIASLPGEIRPKREFYDYAAKYDGGTGTELIVPAELTADQTREVQELAVRAFHAVDCAGMARVDFFLQNQTGRVLVNEINTIPGFTALSMYPKMWEASGVPYTQLIDKLIELALTRHGEKRRGR